MRRSGFFFALRALVPSTVALLLLTATGLGGQERTAPTPGVVEGSVSAPSDEGRRPLAHAWVEVDGGGGAAAVTDTLGAYRLSSVTPGIRTIRAHRLGSRPLEVEVRVPAGDTVRLDLELAWTPLPMAGLTVVAAPVDSSLAVPDAPPAAVAELGVRSLEVGPGLADGGMGAAARRLGGEDPGDPARTLLMRGSTADQKLVLLDGAPVYVPFHLGGLVRSFEPGLLAAARHYVGGAPARYDGGLSYVLDLETRSGREDALHGRASLDLVSGSATLEGPLGDAGSALVSGRALHDAAFSMLGGDGSPYGYGDLLARVDLAPAPGHRLAATAFWNAEEVRLDLSSAAVEGASTGSEPPDLRTPESARWGNAAASLRYRGSWERTALEMTVAGSRYRARLPLGHEDPAVGRARTDRLRAAAELVRAGGPWTVRIGASVEAVDHESVARALVGDTLREATDGGTTESLALHFEGARALGDDVRLRGGLRLDHFPDAGGLRLAPRASLEWSLTADARLRLAAGRFFQMPRGGELEVRMALDDPAGVAAGRSLYPPAEATHLVLSLEQALTSDLALDLEGFVKGFRNLPDAGDDVLRSSGLDLRILRQGRSLSGWLGYSLAWFWRPNSGRDPGRAAAFAGRHLLSAGLRGRLPSGVGGSVRLAYGDGLPYTSVPIFERAVEDAAPDGDPGGGAGPGPSGPGEDLAGEDARSRIPTLDGFLRLDLELHAEWTVDGAGRTTRLRPYLRLLNAVSRRDALFYYFEPWRSPELRALARRPVLPVVGLEVSF